MMKYNKIVSKSDIKNKNTFLIPCVCSILLLLTLCYFGVSSNVKGTHAANLYCDCSSKNSSSSCSSTSGCYWNSQGGYCTGQYVCGSTSDPAPSCSSYTASTGCLGNGCYWNGSSCLDSKPNYSSCTDIPNSYECSVNGCSWNSETNSCGTHILDQPVDVAGTEVTCPDGGTKIDNDTKCQQMNVNETDKEKLINKGWTCSVQEGGLYVCEKNATITYYTCPDDSWYVSGKCEKSSTTKIDGWNCSEQGAGSGIYLCVQDAKEADTTVFTCSSVFSDAIYNNQNAAQMRGDAVCGDGNTTVSSKTHTKDGITYTCYAFGCKSDKSIVCAPKTYYNGSSCVTCPAGHYCPGVTVNSSITTNRGLHACSGSKTSAAGSAATEADCVVGDINGGGNNGGTGGSGDNGGTGGQGGPTDTVTYTYTATFNANGGTLEGSTTKSCSTTGTSCTISSLPTASKDGYTFNGWGTSSSCTSGNKSNLTLSAHTTYYACYSNGTGSTGDGNVTENPTTGEITIALVWFAGLFAIAYAAYYFKQVKQN